jgi:hypothetical protein
VNTKRAFPLLLIAALALAAGCQAPAVVDGVMGEREFTIRDDNPEVRPQHEGTLIVLADDDFGTLRLVKIFAEDLDALPTDEPVAIELDSGVRIEAALGDMESFVRKDGVRVVSSTNAVFVDAVSGTLTLASKDPLAGEFAVTLADGGELVGSFVIAD